jgi:cobalt-zinc-cadmium efflux system membrane fusion protein
MSVLRTPMTPFVSHHAARATRFASIALCAALVLSACSPEPVPKAPNAGPTISGSTIRFPKRPEGIRTEVGQEAGSTALTVPGRLAWDEDRTVRIHSPFAGRVIKPLVQVGDAVSAGQPIALLASADFGSALADARRAETDLKLADDNLARQRELYDAGIVPLKELRAAEAERSRADIEVQRARSKMRQEGGASGPNYTLRAPVKGVVVERTINPGQELRAENETALFVVTDPTRMWAWLDAPERAVPQLAALLPGTPLRIRSTAWGELEFASELLRKEDSIDPELRTFRMRAAVSNPERKLKAGMFVTATFPAPAESAGQLVEHVPMSAVLLIDGKRFVFVQDSDSSFSRTEVKVVSEQAGRAALLGLQKGQRVVTEGTLYLQQILSRNGDPAGQRSAAPPPGAGAAAEGQK